MNKNTDYPKFKKCLHCECERAELIRVDTVQSEKKVDRLDKTGAVVSTGSTTVGTWLGGAVAAVADEGKNEVIKEGATNLIGEVLGAIFGLFGGIFILYIVKKIFRSNRKNGVYLCPQCNEESIYGES